MSNILVVPSNRPKLLADFVAAWSDVADWDAMVVVFDGPDSKEAESLCGIAPFPIHWYSWSDVDRDLGDDAWIASRRNAGIRIFGYLKAFKEHGADVVATLDDDCAPTDDPLFACHLQNLDSIPRWTTSAAGMVPRGMPYRNKGQVDGVALNAGLWRVVGDYDAPRSLVDGADLKHFEPVVDDRLIPIGQYVPISTMSMAFRRAVLPMAYLPKMGQDSPYDRFDDIWGGVILKRVCDHLGWYVSVGRPVITHERASNPFTNLIKEAAGLQQNETFWERIDAIPLDGNSPAMCIAEIGDALQGWEEEYFQQLGKALRRWLDHVTNT